MLAYIIAGAIALAVAFGGGWQVRAWKSDADDKARMEAIVKQYNEAIDKNAKASEALEDKVGKLRPVYRTINNEVQREVVENTVYRDCVVTADGMRLVARAVATANAAGQSDSEVPVTVLPARKGDDGRPPLP